MYEFDTITLEWSRKADVIFSGSNNTEGSFSVINKGYLVSRNNVMEYSPLSDSWKLLSQFPGGFRYGATNFVLDNYAYYGQGKGKMDLWQFNPEYE